MHEAVPILPHGMGLSPHIRRDSSKIPDPVDQLLSPSRLTLCLSSNERAQCRFELGKQANDVRSLQAICGVSNISYTKIQEGQNGRVGLGSL